VGEPQRLSRSAQRLRAGARRGRPRIAAPRQLARERGQAAPDRLRERETGPTSTSRRTSSGRSAAAMIASAAPKE
jgi:hypothetical protein